MTDKTRAMRLEVEMAAPLHIQRLERSTNIQPFLSQMNNLFQEHPRYLITTNHKAYDFNFEYIFCSDDDKSVSSDSSDSSNAYLDDVLTQKEGLSSGK